MRTFIIPDLHIGFFRNNDGSLEALHDNDYLDATLKFVILHKPKVIVLVGDVLDLAGFSTFINDPGFTLVSHTALVRCYDYLEGLRNAAGDADIYYLEGNHEFRIEKRIQERLPELLGLKRVGESTPAWSIASLLRLEALNIRYVSPYGERLYLNNVMYLHGKLIGNSGGMTTAKMLKAYEGNSVQGHTHRLGLNFKTVWRADGPHTEWAMEVGYGGSLKFSIPGASYPDWQQGAGVIRDDGAPAVIQFVNKRFLF